jgi:hypothetical protein
MLAERLSKRIGEHSSTFYPLHATATSPPFRLSDFSLSAFPPCHAVGAQREGGLATRDRIEEQGIYF